MRFGTYNAHNIELIDKLNKVLQDVNNDTIVEEIFNRYFDDEDIKNIIEFFEERKYE